MRASGCPATVAPDAALATRLAFSAGTAVAENLLALGRVALLAGRASAAIQPLEEALELCRELYGESSLSTTLAAELLADARD